MLHRHQWEEVKRTYNPPSPGHLKADSFQGEAAEFARDAKFGYTQVEFRCALPECHKPKFVKVQGKAERPDDKPAPKEGMGTVRKLTP